MSSIGEHSHNPSYCPTEKEAIMTSETPTLPSDQESKSGLVYVIVCVTCQRVFERPTLELDLGEHTDPKTDYLCYSYGECKEIRVAP
jgi:hypothetical protein